MTSPRSAALEIRNWNSHFVGAPIAQAEGRNRFPWLTLLSTTLMPLFAIGSVPILSYLVTQQVEMGDFNSEGARESTGKMAGFAMIVGPFIFGFYGSTAGAIAAVVGHLRREKLLWLRAVSLVGNGGYVCAFSYLFWIRPWLLARWP